LWQNNNPPPPPPCQGGYVNFKELICTLAILCGRERTRHWRLIFDVFDDTRSGCAKNELFQNFKISEIS
jgi:hypothetical protein